MLPDSYCRGLAGDPHVAGAALAALGGDPLARALLADHLEESHVRVPLEVGKAYLICTVTLYYVGRVRSADLGWVVLEDASWVHWTGRLSTLLSRQDFGHRDLSSRKPRLERCGEVVLSLGAVVSAYPWAGPLPETSQ